MSADSVVELFHALLVTQRKSNVRRRFKVISSLGGATTRHSWPGRRLRGPGVCECKRAVADKKKNKK